MELIGMHGKHRVYCADCSLDHIWATIGEAEKERNRHKFNTTHNVKMELA